MILRQRDYGMSICSTDPTTDPTTDPVEKGTEVEVEVGTGSFAPQV